MNFSPPGDQPGSTGEMPAIDDLGHRGLSPQARRRWLSAVGATVALALLTAGVLTLLPHRRHAVTTLADDCGLINCGATLPGAIVTSSPSGQVSTARPHHKTRKSASPTPSASTSHRATPPPAKPTPTPAKPSPTPTQKPPPAPNVGVTYTVDSQYNHWGQNRFHSHVTIVNHSGQTVSGWTIQLSLPGDGIRWVGYRQGWSEITFSNWGFGGSTLTLTAASGSEALAPGAAQTVYIDGDGNAASPSGCSFNGAACHP